MPNKPNAQHKILNVSEQPKGQLYKMSMRFKADADIKTLDEMLDKFFPGERTSLKDGLSIKIEQILPFIPDDATLKQYAKAIEDVYAATSSNTRASNVRFDGYDYVYAIDPETQPEKQTPCVHLKNSVCSTGASSTGACVIPCSHYEARKD